MKKFTKSSLKCGDLIVYRCGAFEVIDEEKLSFIKERYDEELRQLDRRLDIMRVYRYPVWKREDLTITSAEKVLLENKLDTSLLGGVKVCYAGKELDGTVSGRLESLRRSLTQA